MRSTESGLLASAFFLLVSEIFFLVVMEVFGRKSLNIVGHFLKDGHLGSAG